MTAYGAPVDDFRLAYDRTGDGPAVVLLHGWPGDRTDYRAVVPRLTGCDVVVPDLRGFGASDKLAVDPVAQYGAPGQARSVIGLIEELGLQRPVLAGYDIGSRIAQTVAGLRPDLVRGLVVTPPMPGIGARILSERTMAAFWYQSFHRTDLPERLVDGRPDAVRAYLEYFWSYWSGPDHVAEVDHLVAPYSAPGAFVASIGWYRAGSGAVARSLSEQPPSSSDRIAVPTTVLWPEYDPIFPREWADRIGEFYSAATVVPVDGIGHFVPVEAPAAFAAAVSACLS